MPRRLLPLAVALSALALSACGGSEAETTTVSRTTTVTRTVTTPAATTPAATTPAATTPPARTPAGGSLSLREAEQVLDARGYAPLTERDWRPDATLKVLVGVRRGVSADGAQQAFFFAGDRFIGTDTRDPSGRIAVTGQSGDAVALTYALYRPGDSIEQPSGGEVTVTFAWDGSRLRPREEIPPADPAAPRSRR